MREHDCEKGECEPTRLLYPALGFSYRFIVPTFSFPSCLSSYCYTDYFLSVCRSVLLLLFLPLFYNIFFYSYSSTHLLPTRAISFSFIFILHSVSQSSALLSVTMIRNRRYCFFFSIPLFTIDSQGFLYKRAPPKWLII